VVPAYKPLVVTAPKGEICQPGRFYKVADRPEGVPQMTPIGDGAFDNWQEATIILCIAIVGVIYLVVSRTAPKEEKKPSPAAKYLA
jgi:hypothetical protein